MKDRSGERGAGESVKVNDPRAARSWPRRGQRLMGRYIPAAERGWIDVGITGAEQSGAERSGAERSGTVCRYHLAHRALCESNAWAPCCSFRFHKTAFEGSRPECSRVGTHHYRSPCVTLTLTMKRARVRLGEIGGKKTPAGETRCRDSLTFYELLVRALAIIATFSSVLQTPKKDGGSTDGELVPSVSRKGD